MAETAVSSALSSCGAPKDGARLLACEPRVLEAAQGEQERQCFEKDREADTELALLCT